MSSTEVFEIPGQPGAEPVLVTSFPGRVSVIMN
jgi:hypothetical protein